MNQADRKLLLRVAHRMEKAALARYDAAVAANPGKTDSARSSRDNELGDVRDLRAYVQYAGADAKDAERFRFIADGGVQAISPPAAVLLPSGKDLSVAVDAAIAKAKMPPQDS